MATDATDARIDVSGVVEIHKFGQVVNTLPLHALSGLPAFVDWRQVHTIRMDGGQSRLPRLISRTVTVDAGRRRRDRRMGSVEDRVVTVATIQFELPGVNRVAKWHRLLRLVADIQRHRVGHQPTDSDGKQAAAA